MAITLMLAVLLCTLSFGECRRNFVTAILIHLHATNDSFFKLPSLSLHFLLFVIIIRLTYYI